MTINDLEKLPRIDFDFLQTVIEYAETREEAAIKGEKFTEAWAKRFQAVGYRLGYDPIKKLHYSACYAAGE